MRLFLILVDLIMETGGVFHYEIPEPQMDDAGNMYQCHLLELMEWKQK